MNNKLILTLLVIVAIMFFSYNNKQKQVYCEELDNSREVKNIILQKSKEGWKLVSLVSYNETQYSSDFIIVMEK